MTKDIKVEFWIPKTDNDGLPFNDQAWETFNTILQSSFDGVTKSDASGTWYNPEENRREYKEDVFEYEMVIPANKLKRIDRMIKSAKEIFGQHCILRVATNADAQFISLCYDNRVNMDSFTIEMKYRDYGITGLMLPFNSDSFEALDDLYNKLVEPSRLVGSDSPFEFIKFKHGNPEEQTKWLSTHCEKIIIYGDEQMLEEDIENDVCYMTDCCW